MPGEPTGIGHPLGELVRSTCHAAPTWQPAPRVVRLQHAQHLRTGVRQGGGDRQQERPGAAHDHPATGRHAVLGEQRLCGAGGQHAGQVPARERQRPFRRAGGQHDRAAGECHLSFGRAGAGQRQQVEPVAGAVETPDPVAGAVVDAAGPDAGPQRLGQPSVVARMVVPVRLAARRMPPVLAAGAGVGVEQQHPGTGLPGTDRRRHPGRSGADHHHLRAGGAGGHDAPSWWPEPCWLRRSSPTVAGNRQARWLGSPSAVIRQSKQVPIPQNSPRGRPPTRLLRQDRTPCAQSAAPTV